MNSLQNVASAGVIGAGGAGFPTYVKLNTEAEFVLLNGAECEPLLRVDQQLMAVHPKEVILGLLTARDITGAKQAIIGIKESHPEVISVVRRTISEMGESDRVTVGLLPDVYPAGDEQVLVYELTGRIVPETAIPIAVGCVVMNAETAYNVYQAQQGIPVTEKYVTVTGDVPNPITVKVPIGTPLAELFTLAGRPDLTGYKVINGGPMMGPLLTEADKYVTKKTKGLVVLPEDHDLIRKKSRTMQQAVHVNRSACEQCSMCTDLCPRHLLGHSTVPHKIVRAVQYNRPADENVTAALTCCQCNLCEYFSCPAGISPRMANRYYMDQLRPAGIRHTPKDHFEVNPMREYRQIPSRRLIARLNLSGYNGPAPLDESPDIQPDVVGIGLHDHVGAPVKPNVAAGDYVRAGQVLGAPEEGKLGAAVHASISGTVESVRDNLIMIRRE